MASEILGGSRVFGAAEPASTDQFQSAPLWENRTHAPSPAGPPPNAGALRRLELWAAGLTPRRTALYCAILGVAFTLPALWVGFAQDDYAILSVFKGSPGLEPLHDSIWNAFSFSDGDPARNAYRMERGIAPWWVAEGWKVNLWRPLASLSHWFDFVVFGESALPMHIHSLLLYAALCAAATLLYFRLMPFGWAAAAAALLFAIDAAHGIPAGWIANRNAVLAGLFAVLALHAHHRWRTTATPERPWMGWRRHGLLSAACLALALLSAEAAVALGAYYFAYSVTLDPVVANRRKPREWESGRDRVRAYASAIAILSPYLAVVAVWRGAYTGLGHGASDSWLYVDPLAAPGVFARYVAVHTPLLLATLLGLLDTQFWMPMSIELKWLYSASIWCVLVVLAFMLRPLWKSQPVLRFWAIGCVLSVVPIAGSTLPADRNLMLPSIGSAAVIALFLWYVGQRVFRQDGRPIRGKVAAAFACFFLASNVLLSAPMLLFNAYSIRAMHVAFEQIDASVPATGDVAEQTVITLNTPLDLAGAALPLLRSGMERPSPRNWWWLYAGNNAIEVSRLDERTLRLRPEHGFLEQPWAQLFRRPDAAPIAAGHTVSLSRMDVIVTEVSPDGRPLEAEFRFDTELSDPSFVWLAWSGTGYAPFALPAVGATERLTGVQPGELWQLATAFLKPDVADAAVAE